VKYSACREVVLGLPLSYRNIEEMMQNRGLRIYHSSINRWVVKFSGEINARVRREKGPSIGRWKLDEADIRIGGQWMYLYRAVDNHGDAIDFFLSENRLKRAAETFVEKAVK
jgi:transposase-like protein